MLIWIVVAVLLGFSVVNYLILRQIGLTAWPLDFGSLIFLVVGIGLGPIAWLIVLGSLAWMILEEVAEGLYEERILPRIWPELIRRHDAELETMEDDRYLRMELLGWPKYELGFSGGPFGGGMYDKSYYVTYWYAKDHRVNTSEAIVVYLVRARHYSEALKIRTDLWRLHKLRKPLAILVWHVHDDPPALMRQATEDLADGVITQVGGTIDLKTWCEEHHRDLVPHTVMKRQF